MKFMSIRILGVLKDYVGTLSSNVTDNNIEKTRKKAEMTFSSKPNERKTNPLVYIKFWKQACLPSLLFESELFMLTPGLLLKLERCLNGFLKISFMYFLCTQYTDLKLSGLNSIESEIDVKRLLFLGREPKMATAVTNLFRSRCFAEYLQRFTKIRSVLLFQIVV